MSARIHARVAGWRLVRFEVSWAIRLDTLSAVMLVVITSVSGLVHVYSWGYMSHDPHRARFFAISRSSPSPC
jgi:NADH-quinone oxidoreductase subunit L